MSSVVNDPRRFKIEGSHRMLGALAQAIDRALQTARETPDKTGKGSATRGAFEIEVEANFGPDNLTYVIASIDDAVSIVAGWAEAKRCDECEEPVALLFDDAFLETRGGEGVICCECYRRTEDCEEGT
jgi:formylmethanofuran dehydrogenase subunit E